MIVATSIILALALTALGYFFWFPTVSPFFLPLIALGAFVALILLYILYLFISSFLLPRKDPPHAYYALPRITVKMTVSLILTLLGVRIRLYRGSLLPKEPFVLVSNHRSAFDPIVTMHALRKRRLIFASKASVMRLWMIGPYMRGAGFLSIEREHPLQSLRVIRRAAAVMVREGVDFGIYPEGTRSKDGRLGEFKEGAFLAAKKAGAPIVLLAIRGTENIRRRLFPRVALTVIDVIDANTVRKKEPSELARMAHDAIKEFVGD